MCFSLIAQITTLNIDIDAHDETDFVVAKG
jgi:hypothetical protein